jgi:ATP-dependent DNA ligase
MQQASDRGGAGLVYFLFDLLEVNGEQIAAMPLSERKSRLAALLDSPPPGVQFSAHETCDGEAFRRAACRHGLEGVVSKRRDRRYLPGDRSAWIKTKCLNRGEFVVAGWSDPEGSRPYLGSLLPAYHDDDGRLLYAGRVGTGMSERTLAALHTRLAPLAVKASPLAVPPPRETRFGDRLALSRVHWVRPILVAEITYLTWVDDGFPPGTSSSSRQVSTRSPVFICTTSGFNRHRSSASIIAWRLALSFQYHPPTVTIPPMNNATAATATQAASRHAYRRCRAVCSKVNHCGHWSTSAFDTRF